MRKHASGHAIPSAIRIESVSAGQTPLNDALNEAVRASGEPTTQGSALGGQIEVRVEIDAPPEVGAVRLDLFGGKTFRTVEATFTRSMDDEIMRGGLTRVEGEQRIRGVIVFSIPTASYSVGNNGAATVRHLNGCKKLRASLIGDSCQAETQVTLRNANGWHLQATNDGESRVVVTASAINFTAFPSFARLTVNAQIGGAPMTISSNAPAWGTGPVIRTVLPRQLGASWREWRLEARDANGNSFMNLALTREYAGNNYSAVPMWQYSAAVFFPSVNVARPRRLSVRQAPGSALLALARLMFGPRKVERVFRPILVDAREDQFAALRDGRIWEARMALVRGWWNIATAAGLLSWLSLASRAIRWMLGH